MRKSYVWIFLILVGVMTLTTVCYFTMVNNAKTDYANGQLVEYSIREWSQA